MTTMLLWAAFAVFFALVVAAVVVRGVKRLMQRGAPDGPRRPTREDKG